MNRALHAERHSFPTTRSDLQASAYPGWAAGSRRDLGSSYSISTRLDACQAAACLFLWPRDILERVSSDGFLFSWDIRSLASGVPRTSASFATWAADSFRPSLAIRILCLVTAENVRPLFATDIFLLVSAECTFSEHPPESRLYPCSRSVLRYMAIHSRSRSSRSSVETNSITSKEKQSSP